MKINSTYILCMFDYGENVSCCNDISRNPSINFMTGFQVTLSYDQEISFDLKACNSTCLTMLNFFKAVLPCKFNLQSNKKNFFLILASWDDTMIQDSGKLMPNDESWLSSK